MKRYTTFELQRNVSMLDGKECKIMNDAGDGVTSFNVLYAFRKALGVIFDDEMKTITFQKKMDRYKIAEKLYLSKNSVDLSTEEQATLKECVGKLFSGEALGFLERIIEGKLTTPELNGKAQEAVPSTQ